MTGWHERCSSSGPCRSIRASTPVRVCDLGGWTDTWFGGPGRVLNVAVSPGPVVSICATPGPGSVLLDAASFGDRYRLTPGAARPGRHPLLEAAVDALPPPPGLDVEISVSSAVPPGCSTGTSASVAVALVGALAALRGEDLTPRDAAYAAHRLEVDDLGGESGIQDQLSAALGGINYLEIEPYPEAAATTLPVWEDLGARLSLVYLGRSHESFGVHREVIERIVTGISGALGRLREAATAGRDAVVSGDLGSFGAAMVANTEAQVALHPGLVGADARRLIACAAAGGAIGWKVNGAGGEGGSLSVLSPTPAGKEAFERRVETLDGRYRVLPSRLSPDGLVVTGTTGACTEGGKRR